MILRPTWVSFLQYQNTQNQNEDKIAVLQISVWCFRPISNQERCGVHWASDSIYGRLHSIVASHVKGPVRLDSFKLVIWICWPVGNQHMAYMMSTVPFLRERAPKSPGSNGLTSLHWCSSQIWTSMMVDLVHLIVRWCERNNKGWASVRALLLLPNYCQLGWQFSRRTVCPMAQIRPNGERWSLCSEAEMLLVDPASQPD